MSSSVCLVLLHCGFRTIDTSVNVDLETDALPQDSIKVSLDEVIGFGILNVGGYGYMEVYLCEYTRYIDVCG